MITPIAALIVAGAYLVGAIPFGLVIGRLAGVDVRVEGSGNIGATNVARTAGRAFGVLTLVLDAAKGATGPLVALAFDQPVLVQLVAGLAAVLGHVFPVYLRFRGGKGVATATGVFAALTPLPTVVAVAVFALVFAIARVVSLGSLLGSLALVVATWRLDGRREVIVLAGVVTLLIFVRHAGNIRRLWGGRELGVDRSGPT